MRVRARGKTLTVKVVRNLTRLCACAREGKHRRIGFIHLDKTGMPGAAAGTAGNQCGMYRWTRPVDLVSMRFVQHQKFQHG